MQPKFGIVGRERLLPIKATNVRVRAGVSVLQIKATKLRVSGILRVLLLKATKVLIRGMLRVLLIKGTSAELGASWVLLIKARKIQQLGTSNKSKKCAG